MGTWEQTLKEKPDTSSITDLTTAKSALVAYLQKVDTATGNLITTLTNAGAPDVPQGSDFAKAFISELTKAQHVLQQAVSQAGNLPTTDPAAFSSQALSLQKDIENGGEQVSNAMSSVVQRYPSAGVALGTYMLSLPSCKAIGG